jgi:hypothetical protein
MITPWRDGLLFADLYTNIYDHVLRPLTATYPRPALAAKLRTDVRVLAPKEP